MEYNVNPHQSKTEVRHELQAKLTIRLVSVHGVKTVGIIRKGRLLVIYHDCTLFEAVSSVDHPRRVMVGSAKPPSAQAIDKALLILLQSFEEENRVNTR